jgi:hypothetical protein
MIVHLKGTRHFRVAGLYPNRRRNSNPIAHGRHVPRRLNLFLTGAPAMYFESCGKHA